MNRIAHLLLLATLATGCAEHIAPYKSKHRVLDAGEFGARSAPQNGSLYAEGQAGLFEDPIAGRVGDILVIKIDEKDLASHQADTKLDKSDDTSYGVPAAFGFVAALKAKYLTRDDVPEDIVANERRIAEETAKEEGKPEQALPKIVEGRLNGFFKEVALLDQPSVTDSKKTVKKVLDEAGVTVKRFARFEVGA